MPMRDMAGNHIFCFSFTAQQLMTTVRTHVIERAQNLITTAYQHDAFANDLTRHIIIGIRQFAAVSDANPAFGEDVLFFVFKGVLIGIKTGRNGPRLLRVSAKIFG